VRLGDGVKVGPYAIVEGEVIVGSGSRIEGHGVVHGPARIGRSCRLYPYAVAGTDPQDQKWDGERTVVVMGDGVTLREFVTVNRGTGAGGGETVLGGACYLMAHAHVAHDCRLGRNVVVANGATLAGHVMVGDHAVFGGRAAVGQHVRVGRGAFVAAGAMLERDLPPYAIAAGDRAELRGVNVVGMRRLELDERVRASVSSAYAILCGRSLRFSDALAEVERRHGHVAEVREILDFVGGSRMGITPPRPG
jgi:UDP-N-acetylglucosamine acyltransferase